MDAEIVLGVGPDGAVQTTTALLQHFMASATPPPPGFSLYFVYGKLASMPPSFAVGDGFAAEDYDFIVDADIVCIFNNSSCLINLFHPSCIRCPLSNPSLQSVLL